ncbi:hypothetical protein BGZ61DRAFT_541852 [Ilyonectria robusta]|uniref:uncharacterized protein n=1 Tax=Ilyonectria robusta TaxID=1079257 RepID=UPI001E8E4CDB|nr:uncharacterized protein BGZ61DRAFT_541852 [Ilyonectria robusta]KAH8652573.1 hypothetical protein BGZ61DRAFT_541852 [Ilyonectria robusta]
MDSSGAIGAASFSFQLFGACVKGYNNLLTALNMESDLSVLRCRLEIEIQRFKLWGDAAKVSGGVGIPKCHLATVHTSLKCVERLLVHSVLMRHRDDDRVDQIATESGRAITSHTGLVGGSVRWVLADKAGMEGTQREARRSFQELVIRVLGTDNISKIKLLQLSITDRYADIYVLAALKALKLAMDNTEKPATHVQSHPEEAHPNFKPRKWIDMPLWDLSPSAGLEVAVYDRQHVVLEWRRLPKDDVARSQSLLRLEWLMSFLIHASDVPDLRALEFCGATMDLNKEHMAMVYKHPQPSCGREPASLYDLFASPERTQNLPTLNNRFALAVSLAKALVQLHVCGWLHKSICSRNILFFYPEGYDENASGGINRLIGSPFLKGYGYARADMPVASDHSANFSETIAADVDMDLYRHPRTFDSSDKRTTFKKTYDTYSLGILLLEVALWGSNPQATPLQLRTLRQL